jgi:hypothetical protein
MVPVTSQRLKTGPFNAVGLCTYKTKTDLSCNEFFHPFYREIR